MREEMSCAERGLRRPSWRFAKAEKLIELGRAQELSRIPTRLPVCPRHAVLSLAMRRSRAVAAGNPRPRAPERATRRTRTWAEEAALKAAAYLDGMAVLLAGEAAKAAAALAQAVAMPGYQYSIYKLGLARALFAEGKHAEALELGARRGHGAGHGRHSSRSRAGRSRGAAARGGDPGAQGQRSAAAARARASCGGGATPSRAKRARALAETVVWPAASGAD